MPGHHSIQLVVREQPVQHVPLQSQFAVLLEHLMIEPRLRCLTDGMDLRADPFEGARIVDHVVHTECAGEHDRYRAPLTGTGGLFGQKLECRIFTMIEIVEHRALGGLCAVDERRAGEGVRLVQDQRREVADHLVDVGVDGRAVEQRQNDREMRRRRPCPQRIGVDREQRCRRCDAVASHSVTNRLHRSALSAVARRTNRGLRSSAARIGSSGGPGTVSARVSQ